MRAAKKKGNVASPVRTALPSGGSRIGFVAFDAGSTLSAARAYRFCKSYATRSPQHFRGFPTLADSSAPQRGATALAHAPIRSRAQNE